MAQNPAPPPSLAIRLETVHKEIKELEEIFRDTASTGEPVKPEA